MAADRAQEFNPAQAARRAALWAIAVVVLIAVVVPAIGIDDLWPHLARLDVAILVTILALSLLNYAVRALRWHVLSQALRLPVPWGRNTLYYIAGFAFGITPGKVGEVVRLWLMRRHHGTPYERTFSLLLIDRLADALPLIALCLLGAGAGTGQVWGIVVVAAGAAALTWLLMQPDLLVLVVKGGYARVQRRPRLFARALRALRGLRQLTTPRMLVPALALGLLGWSAEIFGAWLVLDQMGAGIGPLETAFVFAFGMLVGSLPLFPGGVGGAEGAMIGVLLVMGVDAGAAVAATAVIRLATLGFAVALGFLTLPLVL